MGDYAPSLFEIELYFSTYSALITLSKATNALVADDTTLCDDLISSGMFHNTDLLCSVTKQLHNALKMSPKSDDICLMAKNDGSKT